jgi:hypothetical protein
MRREHVIAILLAIAAFPAGATLMVAPDYLHLTGWEIPATFWGGIGLTVTPFLVVAFIAWRGESKAHPSVSPLCRSTERDVILTDAIWRVFMNKWEERKKIWDGGDPTGNVDWFKFWQVCRDMQQKAFEGKLPIWATQKGSQLYEPLPLEFWRHNQLNPSAIMLNAPGQGGPNDVWVERSDGPGVYHRNGDWANYSTNSKIIDQLWPDPFPEPKIACAKPPPVPPHPIPGPQGTPKKT